MRNKKKERKKESTLKINVPKKHSQHLFHRLLRELPIKTAVFKEIHLKNYYMVHVKHRSWYTLITSSNTCK
jgi:hypothetical protein